MRRRSPNRCLRRRDSTDLGVPMRFTRAMIVAITETNREMSSQTKSFNLPRWCPILFGGIQQRTHVGFTSPCNIHHQYTCQDTGESVLSVKRRWLPLSVSFQTMPWSTTLVPGSQEPKEDSSVAEDWSIVLLFFFVAVRVLSHEISTEDSSSSSLESRAFFFERNRSNQRKN